MRANDVKAMLNENDIMSLLSEMGADPQLIGREIVSRTVCHNPAHHGKHKLVYYSESKTFHCYTGCGTMDVFGLIGRILNLDFYESFKYVCLKYGISYRQAEIDPGRIDTSFFSKFKKKKEEIFLNTLDENILNSYYDFYHKSWLDDGISIESMKRFGIRYSILDNQIIIPHRDIDGKLIGVRARNLEADLIEAGKKYMPVYYNKVALKHPTGAALYGLNLNKKKIEEYQTVILFESEKAVLQLDTMWPEESIGVCLSGSSLTQHQLDILNGLNIREVVIALDKEFEEVGTEAEKFYAKKVRSSIIDKLLPYFKTSVIWDVDGLTELKDSPTDKGLEVFNELFQKRILI